MLAPQASRDLLGRPVSGETLSDERLECRPIQLPRQRALPSTPFRTLLGLGRQILAARRVATQFATDRRRMAADRQRDRGLAPALLMQLSYAVALGPCNVTI
jgi:hypothetical protein